MKRRRGPSEQIFQESSEFNYYPYSNIKNLLSFNKTLDSIVTLNWRKKLNTKNTSCN